MSESRSLTQGIVLGAALMFLLDPRQGGARRALVRDKSRRAVREIEQAAEVGVRDLSHRAEGVAARLRPHGDRNVAPEVLVERVRSALGKHCSHPHAIAVRSEGDGRIGLEGPILESDVEELLAAVEDVPGVSSVDPHFDIRESPGNVPGLQGPSHRPQRATRLTPTAKLLAGVVAAGVAASSLIRAKPLGLLVGGASVLALARSMNRHGAASALMMRGRPRVRAAVETSEPPRIPAPAT